MLLGSAKQIKQGLLPTLCQCTLQLDNKYLDVELPAIFTPAFQAKELYSRNEEVAAEAAAANSDRGEVRLNRKTQTLFFAHIFDPIFWEPLFSATGY